MTDIHRTGPTRPVRWRPSTVTRTTRTTLSLAATVAAWLLIAPGAFGKRQPINVFPSPGTPVASETTSFSFRGLKPKNLGRIYVYGSRTGRHFGRLVKHSDGRGASFKPKRRFARGETVSVFTGKVIRGAKGGDFKVRIGRFIGPNRKPPRTVGRKPAFPPLHSRPDLRPPPLRVHHASEEAGPGKFFFAPKLNGLTIADRRGRIRWFRPIERAKREWVQDFRSQTWRGRRVLTYWSGVSQPPRRGMRASFRILNERYRQIARFGAGNGYHADQHEVKLTPRNTALVLAYRAVKWNTSRFGGSKDGRVFDNVVQEIDIPTGAVLFEWHSVGNVGLGATVSRPPDDGVPWDYFHVNSADPDGDSILVSARKVSTIYRLDRATGRVKWRLRGDGLKPHLNDFKLGRAGRFGYQHDAVRLANGDISLFDNSLARKFTTVRPQSSGLILRLRNAPGKKGRATLVKRYDHPSRPVVSLSQGSAQQLPNGNMLVGWGSRPRLTEFTPDGRLAFDATFADVPVNSYRARKGEWTGRPRGRPAIASRADGDGAVVWASWNGSSEVNRWQVLTGPSKDDLHRAGARGWRDLETAIRIERHGRVVAVEALAEDGRVLGRSAAARIGETAR
jgi:hypothetical protein